MKEQVSQFKWLVTKHRFRELTPNDLLFQQHSKWNQWKHHQCYMTYPVPKTTIHPRGDGITCGIRPLEKQQMGYSSLDQKTPKRRWKVGMRHWTPAGKKLLAATLLIPRGGVRVLAIHRNTLLLTR